MQSKIQINEKKIYLFVKHVALGMAIFCPSTECWASPEKKLKNLEIKSWETANEHGSSINNGNKLVTIYTGNVRVGVKLDDIYLDLYADCCVVDHNAGKASLYGVWKVPVKTASGLEQESYALRIDIPQEDKIHILPRGGHFRRPPEMRLPNIKAPVPPESVRPKKGCTPEMPNSSRQEAHPDGNSDGNKSSLPPAKLQEP